MEQHVGSGLPLVALFADMLDPGPRQLFCRPLSVYLFVVVVVVVGGGVIIRRSRIHFPFNGPVTFSGYSKPSSCQPASRRLVRLN